MNTQNTILGLDVGANSIGWALIETRDDTPIRIIASGVRIFEARVNLQETGENASRNTDRRLARGRRRILERSARRRKKLLHLLQNNNLLPTGELHGYLRHNDNNPLADFFLDPANDPYNLRARAISEKLTPFEIGRAIYHLARRRGFESNRKLSPMESTKNEIEKTAAETEQEWKKLGFATYGQYLASLDPHQQRRRGKYTLRQWYKDEFEKIWEHQAQYYPELLTPQLKQKIFKVIFYQRPLKSQNKYIGRCQLETSNPNYIPKRAAWSTLLAQRFRMLQDINNCRIINELHQPQPLTPEQRQLLLNILEQKEELNFAEASRILKLPRGTKFNFEDSPTKKSLLGNRTAARMIEIFGKRWFSMSEAEKNQAVEDVRSINSEKALRNRAINHWKLSGEAVDKFVNFSPEPGYCSYSRRALKKLIPFMEQGLSTSEAIQRAYPERTVRKAVDRIPPIENLRNPIVQRALAEMRRLVNCLIARYGKPGLIRVELARELKKSARARVIIMKQIIANTRAINNARKAIFEATGNPNPSPLMIEKYLLWKECNQICPYSGNQISLTELLSPSSRFDIDHIIPFTRSMDNSFANKTLCYVDINRNIKKNQTPWETWGAPAAAGDPVKQKEWKEILERVKKFKSELKEIKLRRFELKTVDDETKFVENFATNLLNDTRYAAKKTREILAQLYGTDGLKHVQAITGQITAYLRRAWDLNSIIGGEASKERTDHRHHAIDAICIALTSPAVIYQLHNSAKRGLLKARPGTFPQMPEPWDGFRNEVKSILNNIIVSHRVSNKVSGPLHEETHYGKILSPQHDERAQQIEYTVIRKHLKDLKGSSPSATEKNIEAIVDKAVREKVKEKLSELMKQYNLSDIQKAIDLFKEPTNHPCFITPDNKRIPIHKVRIKVPYQTVAIGENDRRRLVKLAKNHHLAIYATTDKKGNPTWRCEVVTLLEAYRRKRAGENIIKPVDEFGNKLVFSLCKNEAVEIDWNGKREIAILQNFDENDYRFVRPYDARKSSEKEVLRIQSDNTLFKSNCRKIIINPLGEVRYLNYGTNP